MSTRPNQFGSLPTASAARRSANSGDLRLSLQWEQVEVRLRLLEHPRKGRARHQAVEIGREIFVRLGKRSGGVGVEQRRRPRAVGKLKSSPIAQVFESI